MNSGCTGRVGRLEVTTFTQDALKTTNQTPPPHTTS